MGAPPKPGRALCGRRARLRPATLLLIGLAGLLYVPSIALFLVAAARRDHQAATSPGVREHVR